jgi:hypothetical protein
LVGISQRGQRLRDPRVVSNFIQRRRAAGRLVWTGDSVTALAPGIPPGNWRFLLPGVFDTPQKRYSVSIERLSFVFLSMIPGLEDVVIEFAKPSGWQIGGAKARVIREAVKIMLAERQRRSRRVKGFDLDDALSGLCGIRLAKSDSAFMSISIAACRIDSLLNHAAVSDSTGVGFLVIVFNCSSRG